MQHAQSAKTINSKAAGRLLAAGGIYNGNIEGFKKTAGQLGGDAPAGFEQVMDNKGLLITGASVAAGLAMGKLGTVSELEKLSALSKVPKPPPSEFVNFETRQLQKKFKHAVDFNLSGTPNAEGLKLYEQALKAHIDDPLTQQIAGKYRWNQDVNHYYNPETKIDVMTKPDGNFISGWKLSETQISDLKVKVMSTDQSEADMLALIDSFVSGAMSAPEFEEKYLNAWREHRAADTADKQNKDTQRYFDSVFSAVDSYCSNPDLIDEDDLDAQGLFDYVVNLRKTWEESLLA